MNKNIPVGIDLGTTFSCIGILRDGNVEILQNKEGSCITPSCVSYLKDETLVGEGARKQRFINPQNTVYDIKRLMGKKTIDDSVRNNQQFWTFNVVEDSTKQPVIEIHLEGRTKYVTPEEVSAKILVQMKEIAERAICATVKQVVITVPTCFDEFQKEATITAAKLAGLEVLELVSEPAAAVYAYQFDQQNLTNTNLLVFDFGGGTCDVVVVKVRHKKFDIMAIEDDMQLGGRELDNKLLEYFSAILETIYEKEGLLDMKTRQWLLDECIELKHTLTNENEASLYFGEDFPNIDEINREVFNSLCYLVFHKIKMIIEGTLKKAQMKPDEIDEIILVGGSSRIPRIHDLLKELFPGKKLNDSLHPDEVVAYGAAVRAAQLLESNNGVIPKITLRGNQRWVTRSSRHILLKDDSLHPDEVVAYGADVRAAQLLESNNGVIPKIVLKERQNGGTTKPPTCEKPSPTGTTKSSTFCCIPCCTKRTFCCIPWSSKKTLCCNPCCTKRTFCCIPWSSKKDRSDSILLKDFD